MWSALSEANAINYFKHWLVMLLLLQIFHGKQMQRYDSWISTNLYEELQEVWYYFLCRDGKDSKWNPVPKAVRIIIF